MTDWTIHPLGLIPDATLAKVLRKSPGTLYEARRTAGIPVAELGRGAYPTAPWAWRLWLDAWGEARVRAYLAEYMPALIPALDRDLPHVATSVKREDERAARGWHRRAKKYATREEGLAAKLEALRKGRPARDKAPRKTVEELAELRMRSLAKAHEANAKRRAEARAAAAKAPPAAAPKKLNGWQKTAEKHRRVTMPPPESRPGVAIPLDDPKVKAAERAAIRDGWAEFVARGGKVTVLAPAGSGPKTGRVVARVKAAERFEDVVR